MKDDLYNHLPHEPVREPEGTRGPKIGPPGYRHLRTSEELGGYGIDERRWEAHEDARRQVGGTTPYSTGDMMNRGAAGGYDLGFANPERQESNFHDENTGIRYGHSNNSLWGARGGGGDPSYRESPGPVSKFLYDRDFGRGWEGYSGSVGPSRDHRDASVYPQYTRSLYETREPLRAADLMTENPFALTEDATLATAAAQMIDLKVDAIPVVDGTESRRLIGIITEHHMVRTVAAGTSGSALVGKMMNTVATAANKNDTVNDLVRIMRTESVSRVPVTDREGRLIGMVSSADVSR